MSNHRKPILRIRAGLHNLNSPAASAADVSGLQVVDKELLQLISPCGSNPLRIRRPPNAFMLYAREFRKKISKENPNVSNKSISMLLGNEWKALSEEAKRMYYDKANALDKLHKEKYPQYVYNPKEARIRKQTRIRIKSEKKSSTATCATNSTTIMTDSLDNDGNNRPTIPGAAVIDEAVDLGPTNDQQSQSSLPADIFEQTPAPQSPQVTRIDEGQPQSNEDDTSGMANEEWPGTTYRYYTNLMPGYHMYDPYQFMYPPQAPPAPPPPTMYHYAQYPYYTYPRQRPDGAEHWSPAGTRTPAGIFTARHYPQGPLPTTVPLVASGPTIYVPPMMPGPSTGYFPEPPMFRCATGSPVVTVRPGSTSATIAFPALTAAGALRHFSVGESRSNDHSYSTPRVVVQTDDSTGDISNSGGVEIINEERPRNSPTEENVINVDE